jgi:hypothetical protein
VRKPPTTLVKTHMLVARCQGAVLLWQADAVPVISLRGQGRPVPRRPQGLWRGLLSLPSGPWYVDAASAGKPAGGAESDADACRIWQRWFERFASAAGGRWQDLGQVRHAVTTYRLRCHLTGVLLPQRPGGLSEARWYHPDQDAAPPLTALARKALELNGL